ncbi:hypothetical protein FRC03_007354 [Tulasnella sp. 419]|nr:hypothetical protein FRC02_003094 [Tulasnella sp. 418]KAG8959880.1 hypothetical protein FRC03_007354 [Tulasnella sp. 419]
MVLSTIIGFSTFGVAARMMHLTIQKRALSEGLHLYAASIVGFGATGYLVDEWETRQRVLIAEKHELLKERRQSLQGTA